MAAKKYRVGVIGYGLSAKIFQIPYILASPSFELGAIVQRKGEEAAKDNPGCTIHRSADALFTDGSIDVVVVSTPPATHFHLVSGALNAGKHVIVEKPFCPSSKECDKLIDLSKETGKLLTVFQNRRWDADFATVQGILAEDVLGRVAEFESHFDRYDPAVATGSVPPAVDAPGNGVAYDLGTHLMDQIVTQFGLPSKITANLNNQRNPASKGPEDACTIWLQYASGLLATVKASAVSPDPDQLRYWIRGTKGSYKKYHLDPQEPQLASGMKTDDASFGREEATKSGTLTIWDGNALVAKSQPNISPPTYVKFYDIFAAALRGEGQVPVTAEEGRNVIRLVELAWESSVKGVTLVLGQEDFA